MFLKDLFDVDAHLINPFDEPTSLSFVEQEAAHFSVRGLTLIRHFVNVDGKVMPSGVYSATSNICFETYKI